MNHSWSHRDICSQISIMVGDQIYRPLQVQSLETEDSNFMGLSIHGKLLCNCLLISEPYINLELEIQNRNRTTIKEATVKLIQRRRLHGYSGGAIIFEDFLPDIVNVQDTHLHQTFQIHVIPTSRFCVPTANYTYPDDPDRTCSVSYVLEVEFKTGIFHRDLKLRFPVFVANSEPSPEAGI